MKTLNELSNELKRKYTDPSKAEDIGILIQRQNSS